MIEQGRASDGQQVVAIAMNAGVFTAEEVATVEELWNEYVEYGEASGYIFVVNRDGEHLLGFACFGPRELTDGTYDLYWIAVDIAARGRGIGHTLIRAVEEEARRRGGRILVVETSGTPAYTPTRHFYISSGYIEEAHIRDFYHPGDDLVIFTKHLQELPLEIPSYAVW